MISLYKITDFAKQIIENNVKNKQIAIDFTLGRGNDSIFLSENFKKVLSFDIQKECIEDFRKKNLSNVELILDCHKNIDRYTISLDCGMYNLGYLPDGDKSITTLKESTIISLEKTTKFLNMGGIITVCIYTGHEQGIQEGKAVLDFSSKLDNKSFNVAYLNLINKNFSPAIIVINKVR